MPVRERRPLIPVLGLLVLLWISSWFAHPGEGSRHDYIVFTSVCAAVGFVSWFVGVRLGRTLRQR